MRTELKKFVSSAGPRQTADVQKALKKLLNAGNGTLVLSNWGETVQWMMCSETPEEAAHKDTVHEVFNALHEKHGGTITAKNCRDIIADALAACPALEDSRPVRDERQTTEQVAEETARRSAIHAESAARHKEREEARQTAAASVLGNPDFRHLEPVKGSTKSPHALAASNIRRDLKKAFPGQSFSVTSDIFSGGDSVGIRWENGPTTGEVEAITDKYQEGHFDGMEDLYTYNQSAFCDAFGGAKYVQTSRNISSELRAAVAAEYTANHTPGNLEGWERERWIEREVNNLLSKGSQYGKGAFLGIVDLREGEPYPRAVEYALSFAELPAQTVPAADSHTPAPALSGGVSIEEHTHTKKGFQMFIVVLAERVSPEGFRALKTTAEAGGGWYSRPWGRTPGGFAFKDRGAAETFAASIGGGTPPPDGTDAPPMQSEADEIAPEDLEAAGELFDRLTK